MRIVASVVGAAALCIPHVVFAAAVTQTAVCLKARAPLAAEGIAQSNGFAPAPCPSGRLDSPFRYDRAAGATRLARAVAADEIVPRYAGYGEDAVMPGQPLKLVIAMGAVRIERDVVAMQPAKKGQRLFVKDGDGQILSIRYEGDGQ